MDLGSDGSIRSALDSTRPESVIHAAAMKDVDACELDPAAADRLNVHATAEICREMAGRGGRVIYISTDLVFDGTRSLWTEIDPAAGPGVYAGSKLAAERIVLSNPRNAVVRVSLMYGWSNGINKSFFDWIWSSLGKGRPVRLYVDQYRTPLFVEDAAAVLLELAQRPAVTGMFHLGGSERLSRYDFGVRVCEHFPFDPRWIQPIRMADDRTRVPRPADCSLDSSKLTRETGLRVSGVTEGLEKMSKDYARLSAAPGP